MSRGQETLDIVLVNNTVIPLTPVELSCDDPNPYSRGDSDGAESREDNDQHQCCWLQCLHHVYSGCGMQCTAVQVCRTE